ncbi:OmpA family protein [Larkinella arboricola]
METNGYDTIKNKKLNLRTIKFITGTSQLTPSDRKYLDSIAIFLTRVPTIIMEIGGHTDNTGGAAVNKRLSQERANAVLRYVVGKGVLPRRMKAVGYGSSQPLADNGTEAGRATNRRVEMRFLGLTSDIYTINTKDGKKIRATYLVISADGKTVSYRENANAPLTRMASTGIDYIEYPDGSRRRPDALVLGSGSGNSFEKPLEEKSTEEPATTPSRSVNKPLERVGQWLGGKFPKINRWSLLLNAGVVPLTVKNASVILNYVDESPSKDNLRSDIALKKAQFGIGGQVGFEWETDRQWLTRVQFQFGRSEQAGLSALLVGLGKAFGPKSQLITSLDLTLGNAYLKMGEVFNNDEFIRVNRTEFYSDEAPVKFRNYFAAFTPQVSYNMAVSNNFTLRLTGGYSYSFQTKSVLQFKGENVDGKRAKDSEKLSAPNVDFRVNGKRVIESKDAKLFGIQGPYATVGLLYHIYYRSGK